MKQGVVAVLLIVVGRGAGIASPPEDFSYARPEVTEPDTRLARPLLREPTDEEIATFRGVVGETKPNTLRKLGHPIAVCRWKGAEHWLYQWGKETAWLRFREDGVVSASSYDIKIQAEEELRSTGVILPPRPEF